MTSIMSSFLLQCNHQPFNLTASPAAATCGT